MTRVFIYMATKTERRACSQNALCWEPEATLLASLNIGALNPLSPAAPSCFQLLPAPYSCYQLRPADPSFLHPSCHQFPGPPFVPICSAVPYLLPGPPVAPNPHLLLPGPPAGNPHLPAPGSPSCSQVTPTCPHLLLGPPPVPICS